MRKRIPFAFLPRFQKLLPPILCEKYGPALLYQEIVRMYHSVIYQCQHETIRHAWPQFLHQIQCQRNSSGTVTVEKSYIGIQPHAFQRAGAVMSKQAVCERKHGIYPIQRGSAISTVKKEILLAV